ncbi:hypothetical protein [Methylorubrum populi]
MAEAVQTYIVTPFAGEFVAGSLHGGVGTPISLTDAQARYELLLGTIVLDGTAVPVAPPTGPVNALDRLELTRGSKPWDASVGELAAFLLTHILPDVTETLGDVEGRIVGGAAAADNTLAKLAIRIATLAEQTQAGLQGLAPLRSPAFREAPTAPTPLPGSNSDRLATTAYVTAALAALGLGAAAFASTGSEAGNVPVLDARGKLLSSVLPALAITDIAEVGSQAEMLALTAQTGDIAIRTDLNRTFALAAEPASTLANWKELRTPTDTVLAVAGLTGTITAAALRTALALGISDISGLQAALNGRQAADGTLTALANLTTAVDQLIYATGSDQFALTTFTSLARTLLAGADAAAMRGTLGLGSAAVASTGSAAGNVPVLDAAGKLLSSTLPALAITDIAEVGSQAEMLALTAQTGDIAIRTDLNRTFALAAEPASTLANWKELRTPTDTVLAVAGLTGTITAAALRTALALGISDISGLQTALNGKQAADGTLTALANLTTAVDQLIYATGSDQFALTTFTSLARTLLAGADAAAMRATLAVREVIRGNSGPANIPAGATRYLGIGLVGGSQSDVWIAASRRGRLSNLRVITQAAPGDGQSWTFTVQKLFTDTALTCSIAGSGTNMGTDLTRSADFEASDRLCIKMVSSSGAPATSAIAFSLDFLALD